MRGTQRGGRGTKQTGRKDILCLRLGAVQGTVHIPKGPECPDARKEAIYRQSWQTTSRYSSLMMWVCIQASIDLTASFFPFGLSLDVGCDKTSRAKDCEEIQTDRPALVQQSTGR